MTGRETDEISFEEQALNADGLPIGTLGRPLSSLNCRFCWGTHEVWWGNRWGMKHREKPPAISCKHRCHADDVDRPIATPADTLVFG